MKTNKTSKRAFLGSVISIALCLSMLIGTTFAWFTDTASTSVNKIQAGKLQIGLYTDPDCSKTAEGKTLQFKVNGAVPAEGTQILWEPGCTYELEDVYIKNEGNLALDYTVVITGIGGDVGLNKVIDWTMEVEGKALTAEKAQLLPGKTAKLTISGHMQETAGNEYQDKSIDDIAITVYATQSQYESDSKDNTYDADADMTPDNLEQRVQGSAEVKANEGATVETSDKTATIAIPADALAENTTVTLSKTPVETSGNIEVGATQNTKTYEVSLTDSDGNKLTAAEGKFFTVTLNIGENLEVTSFKHNGVDMTKNQALDAVDQYYYNAETGVVTFTTDDFSPFTAIYSFNGGLGTAEAPYLIATADQAMEMGSKAGYYKLTADIVVSDEIYLSKKTITLDLNGHSITLEYGEKAKRNNGSVLYIGGSKGHLTINDSSESQTGAVYGSTETITNKVTSAVRAGNYGTLTINGGHFYGRSEATSCIFVYTNTLSYCKATVVINGGKFETATPNTDGKYYVLNHQDNASASCTITVNGGSFKNFIPGTTVVDPVNDKTGKIVLGAGYKTVQDGEWYTVVAE